MHSRSIPSVLHAGCMQLSLQYCRTHALTRPSNPLSEVLTRTAPMSSTTGHTYQASPNVQHHCAWGSSTHILDDSSNETHLCTHSIAALCIAIYRHKLNIVQHKSLHHFTHDVILTHWSRERAWNSIPVTKNRTLQGKKLNWLHIHTFNSNVVTTAIAFCVPSHLSGPIIVPLLVNYHNPGHAYII